MLRDSLPVSTLPKTAVTPFPATEATSLGMSPQDREVLERWNSTQRIFPLDRCIHELVSEQARVSPGAVAIVSAERLIRYEGLEKLSNRTAHFLRQRGVGPE